MVPATTHLIGFSGETIWPLGQIALVVKIGDEVHSTSAWMTFMVIRYGYITRTRESEEYKKKPKDQSRSQKSQASVKDSQSNESKGEERIFEFLGNEELLACMESGDGIMRFYGKVENVECG
ncbi:hypothetical protein Tco_0185038 [Tanacetum coccineum]